MTRRTIEDELNVLRAKLQSQLPPRAILAVTSATAGDNVREVAFGLGRSVAAGGRATAIIRLPPDGAGSPRERGLRFEVPSLPLIEFISVDAGPHLQVLSVRSGTALQELSVPAMRQRFAEELRARFEFVVIDAGEPQNNSAGLAALRLADGVLIAAALGRAVVPADRDLVDILAGVKAQVAGIVTSDSRKLRRYADELEALRDDAPAVPALRFEGVVDRSIGERASVSPPMTA